MSASTAAGAARRAWGALAYRLRPRHLPFFLQRMFLRPRTREAIASWLAARLPRHRARAGPAEAEAAAGLARDGFAYIEGLISPAQIRDMHAWLAERPLYDRFHPEAKGFTKDAIPAGTHVAAHLDEDVMGCPHVLSIANDPRVLSIVSSALGCAPTISNLSVWWSVGDGKDAQAAEHFHRDVDDWRFLKLFVYLTDVTDKTGPHVFVQGSHRVPALLKIRRYMDREVEGALGGHPVRRFAAPAGTAFLENTFGLHKGQPVVEGSRLLFQVLYSMYPIGIYEYAPLPSGPEHAALDPRVNRLYLKPPR